MVTNLVSCYRYLSLYYSNNWKASNHNVVSRENPILCSGTHMLKSFTKSEIHGSSEFPCVLRHTSLPVIYSLVSLKCEAIAAEGSPIIRKRRDKKNKNVEGGETKQRSVKGEVKWKARREYEERLTQALQAELEEEMKAYQTRLQEWSKERLEREGFAMFDLQGQFDGSLYKHRIVRFNGTLPGGFLPFGNQSSSGDMVVISTGDPSGETDDVVEGVVLERTRRYIRVSVDRKEVAKLTFPASGSPNRNRNVNGNQKGPFRLDLTGNVVSFQRALAAVQTFSSLSPGRNGSGTIQLTSPEAADMAARDWLARNADPKDALRRATGWAPGHNETKKRLDAWARNAGVSLQEGEVVAGEGLMSAWNFVMRSQEAQVREAFRGTGHPMEPVPRNGTETGAVPRNREAISFAGKAPPWAAGERLPGFKAGFRALTKGGKKGGPVAGLNASQVAAVEGALGRRLTLWRGPPGTGKTRTLLGFVSAFLALKKGGTVLATADSNVAVDNLVEGFLELGMKVVRIGHPAKVKPALRAATLDAQLALHPASQVAADMRQAAILQRTASRQVSSPTGRAAAARVAVKSWAAAEEATRGAIREVLDG